jgi:protein-export membrane protein SecD
MRNRNTIFLVLIIVLSLVAIYIDLPRSPGVHIELGPIKIDRDFEIKQGLDLQGGLQVLLEADVPEDQEMESDSMLVAARIIENRVNALGVVEPLVQTQGDRRIIIELPGIQDPDQAIAVIKETGLLEFVDAGDRFLPPSTVVQTTYPLLESEGATTQSVVPEPVEEPAPTESITETESSLEIAPPSSVISPDETSGDLPTDAAPADTEEPGAETDTRPTITDAVFATVLTGEHLRTAAVQRNEQTGQFMIAFELTEEGGDIFAGFTGRNINRYLSIVLDKEVISSPIVRSQIPDGQGVIEGAFTLDEARNLVVQLRYGALPVPLRVETTRLIGPTLGQDSVQRSIQAGAVGLLIVLLFMLIYYRLPGLLADLALILYGLFNLALYKFIPVTLTLPAITGFILSTGMAVDANILVFERMKEELRQGRSLSWAIEAGFSRAWTSIRDSNISTLITCAILFYFGSTFGAGAVKGFAITLALGVIINIFTAITVTRTFIRLTFNWLGERLLNSRFLLGL